MIIKHGQPLTDLSDWEKRAGPKRPSQWKKDRSAMECARAWLAVTPPNLPEEIVLALRSHADFTPVTTWVAEPEVRLPIDNRPGETRNTDMLLLATDASGDFLVAIEAKADETFDAEMGEVLVEALEAKLENPRSGAVARAIDLASTLLGARLAGHTKVGALRYQLFTAAVGALREAEKRRLTRAVLLVHEFVTAGTADAQHLLNKADLNAWLTRVSGGQHTALAENTVVGPIVIPGAPLLSGSARLYVGKAVRNLRGLGA